MTKKISGRRPLIGLDNNKQQKNQCSLLSANLTLPKHFCDQSLSGRRVSRGGLFVVWLGADPSLSLASFYEESGGSLG